MREGWTEVLDGPTTARVYISEHGEAVNVGGSWRAFICDGNGWRVPAERYPTAEEAMEAVEAAARKETSK